MLTENFKFSTFICVALDAEGRPCLDASDASFMPPYLNLRVIAPLKLILNVQLLLNSSPLQSIVVMLTLEKARLADVL